MKELKGSTWGIKVDKSKATEYYPMRTRNKLEDIPRSCVDDVKDDSISLTLFIICISISFLGGVIIGFLIIS